LAKRIWKTFDPTVDTPTIVQFLENLKRLKQMTLTWATEKCIREDAKLRLIEDQLEHISKLEVGGFY